MSSFKDFISSDLDVFFNSDEFSAEHSVNGKLIPVMVDEDLLDEISRRVKGNYDGLYSEEVTIFVKTADLAERPIVDGLLNFDNEDYIVKSCVDSAGVYQIVLGIVSS